MQITITSGGISAVCAVLALLAAFAVWAVDALIARQIRRLNGRYVFAQDSKITGHEIETRLDGHDEDIRELRARRAAGGV